MVTILVVAFVLGADLIALRNRPRLLHGQSVRSVQAATDRRPHPRHGRQWPGRVDPHGLRRSASRSSSPGSPGPPLLIGSTVGAVSGYFGGATDAVLMRIVDVLLCVPFLSILILIAALFRPGPVALAIILALFGWTGVARLVRGEVLTLRSRDFVDASVWLAPPMPVSSGGTSCRTSSPPGDLDVAVDPRSDPDRSALSFLGFGVNIPTPSWGNMLQGARDYTRSIANVIIPGVMIYITVLAINLVGKGLRDALDPRLND